MSSRRRVVRSGFNNSGDNEQLLHRPSLSFVQEWRRNTAKAVTRPTRTRSVKGIEMRHRLVIAIVLLSAGHVRA